MTSEVSEAQILIRQLDDDTLARLRRRALREGRSLEEECRLLLVAGAQRPDLRRALDTWRAAWPGDDEELDPFEQVRLRGPGRAVDLP